MKLENAYLFIFFFSTTQEAKELKERITDVQLGKALLKEHLNLTYKS